MDKIEYSKVDSRLSGDSEEPLLTQRPSLKERIPFENILIAGLLCSNVLFLLLWVRVTTTDCVRPQLIYTPAKHAISYQTKRLFRHINHNVFTGKPRPEYEEAWRKLVEPIAIKVSNKELAKFGQNSIAFKDGSGYVVELQVYHELHCIKQIRRHLHLDYYNVTLSDYDKQFEERHIDHCLEYWREQAICRGDTTLTAMLWNVSLPVSHSYSDNECVDWEAIDTWARSRMVNMSDTSMLDESGPLPEDQ
ncbi:hypothetical protein K469DRAFT_663313 [Zopfia rhizophila CBS 207.26]|uniref:Tat pathway signal sequence n=1 Tax=Zopfia rhizophila CBS 207.26 TaxID=1314779 RepID=A0A6A6E780_9PEZI|nr:hypothetical protein K469DRAFT_663313 [Zopfia rhizophila CBS 207.26]